MKSRETQFQLSLFIISLILFFSFILLVCIVIFAVLLGFGIRCTFLDQKVQFRQYFQFNSSTISKLSIETTGKIYIQYESNVLNSTLEVLHYALDESRLQSKSQSVNITDSTLSVSIKESYSWGQGFLFGHLCSGSDVIIRMPITSNPISISLHNIGLPQISILNSLESSNGKPVIENLQITHSPPFTALAGNLFIQNIILEGNTIVSLPYVTQISMTNITFSNIEEGSVSSKFASLQLSNLEFLNSIHNVSFVNEFSDFQLKYPQFLHQIDSNSLISFISRFGVLNTQLKLSNNFEHFSNQSALLLKSRKSNGIQLYQQNRDCCIRNVNNQISSSLQVFLQLNTTNVTAFGSTILFESTYNNLNVEIGQ